MRMMVIVMMVDEVVGAFSKEVSEVKSQSELHYEKPQQPNSILEEEKEQERDSKAGKEGKQGKK